MKTIYRSEKGKEEILSLYDAQLARLGRPYKDIYVETSFGNSKCLAPALVMGAEKDCLFPGAGVIERAEKIIPNCKTYLLRGRGHMHFLTDEEKKMIVDFLLE
jgi:pimeloyl-ACP methyl ester carboxylesterase